MLDDFLIEIPVIWKLHYNAWWYKNVPEWLILDEGMLIANDVGAFDWCKYSDFVESILLFLIGEAIHFDFFQSINLGISVALNLVDARIRSFT